MSGEWRPPENHPITDAKAREIVALTGKPSREFIASCCVPLFWWATDQPGRQVMANGTVTLVKTPAGVIGLTADHVIKECLEAFDGGKACVQIADASAHDLRARVIARSKELDLASLNLDGLIERLGWPDKSPLTSWPPTPPQEGRGIMIGGYPGNERQVIGQRDISFGIFTALAIARTVSHDQISCLFEREYMVEPGDIPTLPPNTDLGGISGGPVITVCESPSYFVTFRLGGIVSEAHSGLEKVFAKRVDFIRDDGRF
jgi:hypothetical protein